MKRIIIEIGSFITIVIIVLIIIFGISKFFKKQITALEKKNNEVIVTTTTIINEQKEKIKSTEKERDYYKNNIKIVTKIELVKMPSEEKDKLVLILQDDKLHLLALLDIVLKDWSNCVSQLEVVNGQLIKTNKALKQLNKSNEIDFYVMSGLSGLNKYFETNKINYDIIVGIDYTRLFIFNRLGLIIGGWVKVYDDVGIGIKLGGKFRF